MWSMSSPGTSTARAEPFPARSGQPFQRVRFAGAWTGARIGRWQSRVRGLDEVFGELPVACLAEEIDTPGEGQVRAMITMCGNPVLSTPNSGRLDAALAELDFMVCVDVYVNETTRHADVILPGPSPLRRSHYDLAFISSPFATSRTTHLPWPADPDVPDEWVTCCDSRRGRRAGTATRRRDARRAGRPGSDPARGFDGRVAAIRTDGRRPAPVSSRVSGPSGCST